MRTIITNGAMLVIRGLTLYGGYVILNMMTSEDIKRIIPDDVHKIVSNEQKKLVEAHRVMSLKHFGIIHLKSCVRSMIKMDYFNKTIN